MCGHVGVAGRMMKKEEDAFKQLLIVDSLRGIDSTGIAVIGSNNVPKIVKAVGNPFELLDKKAYDKALVGLNRAIIGHNRYSTVGASNLKNAHPFEYGDITGAHNGTLTNKYSLKDGHQFDVDSQAMLNHIDSEGLRDAINKAQGAWALVWWDAAEETLNFLRNKDRPLWYIATKDSKTLFWASEAWMLEGVLNRNGIEYEGSAKFIPTDMHISFEIDSLGAIGKPTAVEMKPKVAQAVQQVPFTGTGATSTNSKPLLTLVKKDGVTPKTSFADYRPLGGHEPLEVMSMGTDKFGSSFFQVMDWNCPEAEIRLYYTRLPFVPETLIGKTVNAIVNPVSSSVHGTKYWKVHGGSINWDDVNFEEDDPVGGKVIYDHHAKEISEEDFYKRYGECCWCSGLVNPDQAHALTKDGQGICHVCLEDKQVMQYTDIAGGIRNSK